MATEIAASDDRAAVVSRLAPTWSHLNPAAREALEAMADRLQHDCLCTSLPLIEPKLGRVHWVSLGVSLTSINEYAEDLRCWILPYYGTETRLVFVNSADATSALGPALIRLSPGGYLRWRSAGQQVDKLITTLTAMHGFLDNQPTASAPPRPSLSSLRLRFIA